MNARLVAALAVLCGCEEARGSIRLERTRNGATTELTGISTDLRGHRERPRPQHFCELGAKRFCFGGPGPHIPGPVGEPGTTLYERCVVYPDGIQRWSSAECNTPLVIALDAAPVEFTRVDVAFTIGKGARTEWVSAKTPWLALDRDGSGCIESERELFAGFEDLARLDADGSGRIDRRDPAFAELLLWSDRNQDKRCTPDEIAPLASADVDALELAYETRASSGYGSYEGETAVLARGARLVDVHLAVVP